MFLTEKEAVDLLGGAFGEQLLKGMLGYVTTISWGFDDRLASKYKLLNHGTAFLANFGESTFLITAAHVLEGFRDAKSQNPLIRSYVGELEFDLDARLISCLGSSTLDVATFDITSSEISRLGKAVTYGAKNWPPEEGYDLGGISGGPAFVLKKSEAGLFSWDLVGVVYTAMRFDAEILLVHHAKYISANGVLKEPIN
jgi:hypothetical protein